MLGKRDRQVILNLISGLGGVAANAVLFLFVTPYVIGKLSSDGNGLWWLIGTFGAYLGLIYSCVSTPLVKYAAEYRARGQRDRLQCVANSALVLYCVLGGVALVAGTAIYAFAGSIPAIRDSSNPLEVQLALGVLLVGTVVGVPFTTVNALIAGLQRYDFLNLSAFVKSLIRAGGIVWLLGRGHGLVAMAGWAFVVDVAGNGAAVIFLRRIESIALSWRSCSWREMKSLLRFGRFSMLGSVSNVVFDHTDYIVVGAFVSAAAVTVYGLGLRLIQQLTKVSEGAMKVLMPVASEISVLEGRQRRRKLEELFVRGSRFSTILTLPWILFLLVWGREFIGIWQGTSYAPGNVELTYWVFVILAVSQIAVISQHIGGQMLIGLGKLRFPVYLSVGSAVMNVVLSIALVGPYGVLGVAMGTAVPLVIRRVILQFYYRTVFEVSMRRYYWQVWSRLAPLGVALGVSLLVQKWVFSPSGLPAILVLAAVNVVAFYALSYWSLDAYEREVLGKILRKGFGQGGGESAERAGETD